MASSRSDHVVDLVAAQQVARMAVAVQADRLVGHLGEQGVEAFQQVAGDRLVAKAAGSGDEIAFQQGGQRGVAEVITASASRCSNGRVAPTACRRPSNWPRR